MIWIQPLFIPGSTRFSSSNASSPFSCIPELAGDGIEGHAEAVAEAVREDLLHVGADLAADRRAGGEERVVGRRRAVVVEPQDDAGEMRVVGLRAAELVVGDGRPGHVGGRPQAGSAAGRAGRRRRP